MKLDRHPPRDDVGASSVEYGILISLVAAVIVTAILAFGGLVGNLFSGSCQELLARGVAEATTTPSC